jgi:UDP-N-acetylmuramate--alanine ligase
MVVIADVYPAGEAPIEGVHRDALVQGIIARGHRHVMALESAEALPRLIAELARKGDFVVCLGAGSITQWANALPGGLHDLVGAAP